MLGSQGIPQDSNTSFNMMIVKVGSIINIIISRALTGEKWVANWDALTNQGAYRLVFCLKKGDFNASSYLPFNNIKYWIEP